MTTVAHGAVLCFGHRDLYPCTGCYLLLPPAGGSREVLCPLGRIQAEALVNCRAQCLFVVRIQTPNVILAGSDVHYPHIMSTPKCRDKIVLIYQRVRGDQLVTRIALDF
jgi:hypothetical protein